MRVRKRANQFEISKEIHCFALSTAKCLEVPCRLAPCLPSAAAFSLSGFLISQIRLPCKCAQAMSLCVQIVCGGLIAIQSLQVLHIFCQQRNWCPHRHSLPLGNQDTVHIAIFLHMQARYTQLCDCEGPICDLPSEHQVCQYASCPFWEFRMLCRQPSSVQQA